jgi:hypothetical protein
MMFIYEGSELIGFLLNAIAISFLAGIIAIPFILSRIEPVLSISLFFYHLITHIQYTSKSFSSSSGKILDLVPGIITGTVYNLWC